MTKIITKIVLGLLFCTACAAQSQNVSLEFRDQSLDRLIDGTFTPSPIVTREGKPLAPLVASALQPDGKFVVSGYVDWPDPGDEIALIRMNSDGTLDTNFAPQLKFCSNCGFYGQPLLVQPDGRILTAYDFVDSADHTVHAKVVRLFSDGTPDPSFDGTLGNQWAVPEEMLIQSDGKIMLVLSPNSANTNNVVDLRRLNTDGTLDSSYTVRIENKLFDYPRLALQSDGKLLVRGPFTNINNIGRKNLARLMTDGSIDPGFVPPAIFDSDPGEPFTLGLARDGRILVSPPNPAIGATNLIRLETNGDLDPSYEPFQGDFAGIYFQLADGSWLVGLSCLDICGTAIGVIGIDGSLEWSHYQPPYYMFTLLSDGKLLAARGDPQDGYQLVRLLAPPPVLLKLFFSIISDTSSNGLVQLEYEAKPGSALILEASGDLKTWTQLDQIVAPFVDSVGDPGSSNGTNQRFYRIREVPSQ